MNEIEIKAHVYKKDELIKKLNSFAEFKQEVLRDDTYYESPLNPKIKIRIRKEKYGKETRCILTYKQKEVNQLLNALRCRSFRITDKSRESSNIKR